MQKINIRNRDIYFYDNGCNVEEWLKQGSLYGEANYKILSKLIINQFGWILDCGAHIGTFSLPAELDGRKVIKIEAAAKNIECLNKTFDSEVYQAILADSKRMCRFSEESGPFGWIIEDENGDVLTDTIDSIVGDRKIIGIKLDIEGGEIKALDGAIKTLQRDKPPILMEVNGWCLMQQGKRSEDLLKKIESFGYVSFVIINNRFFKVDTSKLFPFCNIDAICIHRENLPNYHFNISHILSDHDIEYISKEMCMRSNEECKKYFKSIGIE
jgi:FkbM family methyltransferase